MTSRSVIKGVLFDWTGVIMDELKATGLSEIETIAELGGKPPTYDTWCAEIHTDWRAYYLSNGVKPTMIEKVPRIRIERFKKYAHLVKPFPGVVAMLKELRRRGIVTGVVSAQMREILIPIARQFVLIGLFDLILSAEDVTPPKPDPEPLRHALRTLKLHPIETMYLDDMEGGVKSGLVAGVITVGVRSQLKQDLSHADIVIDSASALLSLLATYPEWSKQLRPLSLATAEQHRALDERYKRKCSGDLQRISWFYHADNLAVAKELLAWNVVLNGGVIADVGCGTSVTAEHIVRAKGGHLLKVDLSRLVFEVPCASLEPELTCLHADAASLPINSGSVDLAICSETLEHVTDDRTAVSELARILKPNGYLVVSIPNAIATTFPPFRKLQSIFNLAGHLREYEENTMRELLMSTGYDVIRIVRSSFFVYWTLNTLERSSMATMLDRALNRMPWMAAALRTIMANIIFVENRLLRSWCKGGMCVLYLARKRSSTQASSLSLDEAEDNRFHEFSKLIS